MKLARRTEPLTRRNLAVENACDGEHTGANFEADHQHGARAALRQTAAEFWTVEAEVVAQDIEQWSLAADRYGFLPTIHLQHQAFDHGGPPCSEGRGHGIFLYTNGQGAAQPLTNVTCTVPSRCVQLSGPAGRGPYLSWSFGEVERSPSEV